MDLVDRVDRIDGQGQALPETKQLTGRDRPLPETKQGRL